MTSDFPRSPKFLKGALVAYASQFLGPLPNVIVFQYNPAQLSRSLAQRGQAPEPSPAATAVWSAVWCRTSPRRCKA